MNIGIDIDGVLIDDDTYRLDTMTKYAFENNLPKLEYPYAFESKNDWNEDIKWDYKQKYFFDYIKNAPIRKYAKEIIQKLHNEGHKIIIITGRYKTREQSKLGEQMRNDTVNWLKKIILFMIKLFMHSAQRQKKYKKIILI